MASSVEICNRALIRLGADTITSLTENSKEARLCNIIYDQARKDLLRLHPWNFAVKRIELASSTNEPDFEYTYSYPLPSDCLRIFKIYNQSGDYKVEGRNILYNNNSLQIIYIADVTDTGEFDSLFTSCLAIKIAAEIGFNITGTTSIYQALQEELIRYLREAKTRDGQEGSLDQFESYDWIDSRY